MCSAQLHPFNRANGHISFTLVTEGEYKAVFFLVCVCVFVFFIIYLFFTLGDNERAISAALLHCYKLAYRLPDCLSYFLSNPMATPSGQDKSKHGAGIKIALCSVTCAALMCSGFAKDFGFASPFSWQEINLWQKAETPSSGWLMPGPVARWDSSTPRTYFPSNINFI